MIPSTMISRYSIKGLAGLYGYAGWTSRHRRDTASDGRRVCRPLRRIRVTKLIANVACLEVAFTLLGTLLNLHQNIAGQPSITLYLPQ